MSSTEPPKTTITTFPPSAVKIPAVTTEEQQSGRPVTDSSAVLTTEQPTTNNISIKDLTSEPSEASPFEIEQTTRILPAQPGLYLTTEMAPAREYSDNEISSLTTQSTPSNTIIGGESVSPLPSEISSAPDRTREKEKTATDVIAGAEETSPGRLGGVTQREEQTSSAGVVTGGKVLDTTVSYDVGKTIKTPTSINQGENNSAESSTSSSATTTGRTSPSPGVMTTTSREGEDQSRTEPSVPPPPQPRLDDGLLSGN